MIPETIAVVRALFPDADLYPLTAAERADFACSRGETPEAYPVLHEVRAARFVATTGAEADVTATPGAMMVVGRGPTPPSAWADAREHVEHLDALAARARDGGRGEAP
jgi:hypothetical protein